MWWESAYLWYELKVGNDKTVDRSLRLALAKGAKDGVLIQSKQSFRLGTKSAGGKKKKGGKKKRSSSKKSKKSTKKAAGGEEVSEQPTRLNTCGSTDWLLQCYNDSQKPKKKRRSSKKKTGGAKKTKKVWFTLTRIARSFTWRSTHICDRSLLCWIVCLQAKGGKKKGTKKSGKSKSPKKRSSSKVRHRLCLQCWNCFLTANALLNCR